MGTLRWQKERDEAEERERLTSEFKRQSAVMDDELEDLENRVQTLQRNIAEKRLAKASRAETERLRDLAEGHRRSDIIELRQSEELGSSEKSRP
jgi:Skp family chaperone for outer membrane proteins